VRNVPSILIAGIGNVFLGDDAFGIEVVRKLALRPSRDNVHVKDFGIRGLDLAWAICDRYDAVILVDALRRNGAPGTVYLLEATTDFDDGEVPDVEPHQVDPASVIRLARAWGEGLPTIYVVGCEPLTLLADDVNSLSPPVAAAVDEAVQVIDCLVEQLQSIDLQSTAECTNWALPGK
jgi:hydrogenase maturation protease